MSLNSVHFTTCHWRINLIMNHRTRLSDKYIFPREGRDEIKFRELQKIRKPDLGIRLRWSEVGLENLSRCSIGDSSSIESRSECRHFFECGEIRCFYCSPYPNLAVSTILIH